MIRTAFRSKSIVVLVAVSIALSSNSARCFGQRSSEVSLAPGIERIDEHTLKGSKNFLHDYSTRSEDDLIHVVVEIPAGTNAKWEVDPADGLMKWDFKDGKPRVVSYLGYPGNYGMVPRTSLPKELGGDGCPLDVLILGPATARGEVVKVRMIGVLKYLDSGEHDDKILAVMPDTKLGAVRDLEELEKQFPGALTIVQLWFDHYKGPGIMEAQGVGDETEASRILEAAMLNYSTVQPSK